MGFALDLWNLWAASLTRTHTRCPEASIGGRSAHGSWDCEDLVNVFVVCSAQFLLDITVIVTIAETFQHHPRHGVKPSYMLFYT